MLLGTSLSYHATVTPKIFLIQKNFFQSQKFFYVLKISSKFFGEKICIFLAKKKSFVGEAQNASLKKRKKIYEIFFSFVKFLIKSWKKVEKMPRDRLDAHGEDFFLVSFHMQIGQKKFSTIINEYFNVGGLGVKIFLV